MPGYIRCPSFQQVSLKIVRGAVKLPVPSEQSGPGTDARDFPGLWMPTAQPRDRCLCLPSTHPCDVQRHEALPTWSQLLPRQALLAHKGPLDHCIAVNTMCAYTKAWKTPQGGQLETCWPNLSSPSTSEVNLSTHVQLPGSPGARGRNGLLSYSTGSRNASTWAGRNGLELRGCVCHVPLEPLAPSRPSSTGRSWKQQIFQL